MDRSIMAVEETWTVLMAECGSSMEPHTDIRPLDLRCQSTGLIPQTRNPVAAFSLCVHIPQSEDRVKRMAWRELYSYWRGRHADGHPPSRADIDPPIDIPKLLPNLIIFDRVDGHFRVRLAGSEVVRRGGRDATGRILDRDMVTYDGIITLIGLLERVIATGEPVIYSVARGSDTAFGAIAILLPLSGADGKPEMVLGGVFFSASRIGESSEPWTPGALTELSLPEMLEQDTGLCR